jgi:phosphonate transport system ATP-binding protein
MTLPSQPALGASVSIRDVSKSYVAGRPVLRGLSLEIAAGECVALLGASGSGKSTLMRLLPGFMAADAGSGPIAIGGAPIQSDGKVVSEVRVRRAEIGCIFQQFNLVGQLDVLTNVLIGLLARVPTWRSAFRRFSDQEVEVARDALAAVGLADFADRRASTLSGGQQQRVAIARCLVQQARVILADEPIASLDPESARNVMEILARIHREHGVTVVVSLHQVAYARRYCQRVVALRNGDVVHDGRANDLSAATLRDLYGTAVDELLAAPEDFAPIP